MTIKAIRIGTRSSPMAMAQANYIKSLIHKTTPLITVEIKNYTTTGDKFLQNNLIDIGGKGLFTKEIEKALLDNEVDIAVHCAKDMPIEQPKGLIFPIVLPAQDPRDCFVSRKEKTLDALPSGSCVGTASLRRQAYIKKMRPDLNVKVLRGTVSTRIKKLDNEYDAAILSFAGLERLNISYEATEIFNPTVWVPAVGQGILSIQTKENTPEIKELLGPLHCPDSAFRWTVERLFMKTLDGSCRAPIGGYALLSKDKKNITFYGMVGNPNTLLFSQDVFSCSLEQIVEKIVPFALNLKQRISFEHA